MKNNIEAKDHMKKELAPILRTGLGSSQVYGGIISVKNMPRVWTSRESPNNKKWKTRELPVDAALSLLGSSSPGSSWHEE